MNQEQQRPTIPGYEILERLGGRRLGAIYKARQASLDRLVALRILDPVAAEDTILRQRLRAQTQAASLHHGNLVHVIEAGEHEGTHYLVMEYVSGFSLAERLAKKQLMTVSEAHLTLRAVADALDYTYRKTEKIHADLRPENILVDEDGTIKVGDFLGFALPEADDAARAFLDTEDNPYYPADPAERVSDWGPPMDIRALGRLLYHTVTGNPLEAQVSRDAVCNVFLQVAQLHPDADTRAQAADLAHLLLDLIEAGPDKRFKGWADVLASIDTPAPDSKPEPDLAATQVIPHLAGQRPPGSKRPMRIRREELETAHDQAPAASPLKPARATPSRWPVHLAIFTAILLGAGALFWADTEHQLFDPLRDLRDTRLGALRGGERPTEETPEPAQPELEPEMPVEEIAEREEPEETPVDPARREAFHAYLQGMETVLRHVAQRDLPGVGTGVDDWLAQHADHPEAQAMQQNKLRALAIARVYRWLPLHAGRLRGLLLAEDERRGRIAEIHAGAMLLESQRGGTTIEIELPFSELSLPNLVRLVRHTEPPPEEEHLFSAFMAAGRYDDAAEELERLTLPPDRIDFLRDWLDAWRDAHLNLAALRALTAIEEDLGNNRPIEARDKLEIAEQRFGQTPIFTEIEAERARRVRSDILGTP